jgi:hypothetical protein
MIDHVWTVVCTNAVIDQLSNNVSLHNIIEQVTIRGEPKSDGALDMPLYIMTLWTRSDFEVPAQGHARVAILSPSGVVGDPFEYEIDWSANKRQRVRLALPRTPIHEPGHHAFIVEFRNEGETEWRQVAASPLEVIFESPEATEQAVNESEQD